MAKARRENFRQGIDDKRQKDTSSKGGFGVGGRARPSADAAADGDDDDDDDDDIRVSGEVAEFAREMLDNMEKTDQKAP